MDARTIAARVVMGTCERNGVEVSKAKITMIPEKALHAVV